MKPARPGCLRFFPWRCATPGVQHVASTVRAAQHLGRHVEVVRHGFGHHAAWADEDARDAGESELRGFPEERELALRASVHWAAQVECRLCTDTIAVELCMEKFEVAGQALPGKLPTSGSWKRYPSIAAPAIIAGSACAQPVMYRMRDRHGAASVWSPDWTPDEAGGAPWYRRAPGGCAIAREALRRSCGARAVDCMMLLLAATLPLWPRPGVEARDATRCVGVPIEFEEAEEPRTVPVIG